jgi:hypothetical protein
VGFAPPAWLEGNAGFQEFMPARRSASSRVHVGTARIERHLVNLKRSAATCSGVQVATDLGRGVGSWLGRPCPSISLEPPPMLRSKASVQLRTCPKRDMRSGAGLADGLAGVAADRCFLTDGGS